MTRALVHQLLVPLIILGAATSNAQLPTTAPGSRIAALFAYDSLHDRLILYGGKLTFERGTGDPGDPDPKTYAWTADGWSVIAHTGPRSRDEVAYGYDARAGGVIMFGGRGQSANRDSLGRLPRIPFRETWQFVRSAWTLVDTTGPGGRASPQAAFDAVRGVLVVFGGRLTDVSGPGRFPSDTWEWDGRRWTRFDVPGPAGRHGHVLAYDPGAREIVLHGGANGPPLTDTWTWNGQRWHQRGTDGPKSIYGAATGGLDSGIVLFGGHDGSSSSTTTWHWDGREWRSLATTGPAGRTFNAMTTDRRNLRIYMLGGAVRGTDPRTEASPELWQLDSEHGWVKVSPTGSPPRR